MYYPNHEDCTIKVVKTTYFYVQIFLIFFRYHCLGRLMFLLRWWPGGGGRSCGAPLPPRLISGVRNWSQSMSPGLQLWGCGAGAGISQKPRAPFSGMTLFLTSPDIRGVTRIHGFSVVLVVHKFFGRWCCCLSAIFLEYKRVSEYFFFFYYNPSIYLQKFTYTLY